jgi:hypothetical protein
MPLSKALAYAQAILARPVAPPGAHEWRELAQALQDVSDEDRVVLLGVIRRVAEIQAEGGEDAALAALDRLTALLSGERRVLG